MKKGIIGLVAIILIGGVLWFGLREQESGQRIATPDQLSLYVCPDGSLISAGYTDGGVAILLPDGREFTLEQKPSASGVRYANEGDQIVFHAKENEVFVIENGDTILSGCIYTTPDE